MNETEMIETFKTTEFPELGGIIEFPALEGIIPMQRPRIEASEFWKESASAAYAKMAMQFNNEMRRASGLNFPEACFCGGHIHKLGMRSDLKACPLLSPKTKSARLAAIGRLLDPVLHGAK